VFRGPHNLGVSLRGPLSKKFRQKSISLGYSLGGELYGACGAVSSVDLGTVFFPYKGYHICEVDHDLFLLL